MLFESPLFLAGASAAAVPVVIHFLFRKKARKIRFPSLMLLKRVRKNITRYHKLREIILLLLRVAAILLLVLALAKPFLPGFGHQGAACTVFVIDDTISMGKLCEGTSRFESGIEFALGILSDLDQGSKAGFVLSSLSSRGMDEPVEDLALVRENLRKLKPGGTGNTIENAVKRAVKILSSQKGLPAELYIISDRQDEIGSLDGLPEHTRVFYADCFNSEELTNVVVENVQVPKGPFPEMSEIEVKASLLNAGEAKATGKISLEIAGTEDTREISLEKGEHREVVFRTLPLTRGKYDGRVSYERDCIPGDSERFFSVETGNPMRILVLEQEGELLSEEEKYFRSALNPWGEHMNIFVLEHSRIDMLTSARLSDIDLVVCFRFLPLVHPSFSLVREYVREGGSLILFSSADYNIQALNRAWDTSGAFMPWKILTLEKQGEGFSLRRINYSYPGFVPLRNIVDPEKARFLQRFVVKPDSSSNITVLAEFEDRLPAVLSASFGKGESVFFSWGLSSAWTDAPYRNFFAPMMNELSRYLCGRGLRKEEYVCGTPVAFPLKQDADRAEVTIPGSDIPIALTRQNGGVLKNTFTAGCYSYVLETENETLRGTMVFNPAAADGEKESMDEALMRKKLSAAGVEMIRPDPEAVRTIGTGRRGRSLRDVILIAAVLILLTELYMSNSMAVRKYKADNAVS